MYEGGIYSASTGFEMISSRVMYNDVSGGNCGGIAVLRCESGIIKDSNISFNSARIRPSVNIEAYGGGLCLEISTGVVIENSHFGSNQAATNGGAIKFSEAIQMSVWQSTFASNRAAVGGSVIVQNSANVNISHAEFTNSFATYNGGGVMVESSVGVVITNSLFTRSQCASGYGSSIG
jgi:predicted outer membrane repeat protein